MAVDPETLSYSGVEQTPLSRLGLSYRRRLKVPSDHLRRDLRALAPPGRRGAVRETGRL